MRAMALLQRGEPVPAIADFLGVEPATVYRWRNQALIDSAQGPSDQTRMAFRLVEASARIAELEDDLANSQRRVEALEKNLHKSEPELSRGRHRSNVLSPEEE